jgi:hypothetical protein
MDEMTASITVTKAQLEMLRGLARLGIYGDTIEEVVAFFFVRELDRVLADDILPNYLHARNLL